jgi:polar amino acid transport system substrate-binding protein
VAGRPLISHPLDRRNFLRGTVSAGVLLGGTALLGAGCSRAELTGNTLERITEEGKVRVAFAQELPYGYIDIDGKLVGESPDVAKAVFDKMGIAEVEAKLTAFGSLIPALQAGSVDVVAAGMFINPDRCASVAFSEPDYTVEQALLVPAGNPDGVQNFADVAETGITLGVMEGAIERDYAAAAGVENFETFTDQASGFAGVEQGRADALALTSISLRFLLKNRDEDAEETEGGGLEGSDLWVTPSFIPQLPDPENPDQLVDDQGYGGFAFRTSDTELREEFNRHLVEMQENGEWLEIVEPYGFEEPELPVDKTTQDLCPDAEWL